MMSSANSVRITGKRSLMQNTVHLFDIYMSFNLNLRGISGVSSEEIALGLQGRAVLKEAANKCWKYKDLLNSITIRFCGSRATTPSMKV